MELQDLLNFAKEVKGVSDWDTPTIIRVGGALAAKVNTLKNISGGEKQKLVLQILRKLIDESALKELATKDLTKDAIQAIEARYVKLKVAVDEVLPASLELAINAARGKLELKKIKPSVWVKFCSCFASTVVSALASQKIISEAQASQFSNVLNQAKEKAEAMAAAKEAAEEPPSEPKPSLELRVPGLVESKSVEDKKEENVQPSEPVADTAQ